MSSPSQQVSVPWPVRVGCACVGVLAGVLLRFGADTSRPKLLPFENAETSVRTASTSTATLPASLKTIETELQATLVAGRQAAEGLAARERWLQTFIEQLAPGEFAEAARRGLRLPENLRRNFLLALIGRWAERNGVEAIGFAEGRAPEELRQALIEEALDHWATADASGALRWIMQHTDGGRRSALLEQFIRAVEGTDPASALAALEKLPRSGSEETKRQELARRLAEHDLPAAIIALLNGRRSYNDGTWNAATDLAALWLDQDPAVAMAWAAQLRNPEERRMFEQHLASAWARKDIQAVLHWVSGQPAEKRSFLLSGVMEHWAKQDPGAAKEYALTLPNGQDRTTAIFNVACQLALDHNDLPGALELHKQLGSSEEKLRVQLFRELVGRATNDYRQGAEILRDLPPNEENLRLLDRYIARWVWDGEAAGQFIKENGLADELPETARSYALQLSRKAADTALTWARELPPGAARDNALCGALYGLAEQDPARAANLLREISAPLQSDAARAIADQWFGKDPARATAWAQSLADEQSRTIACASLVESWSRKDPTGPVVQWIESLPPGPTYDVAVAKYAKSVTATDPEAGLAWIATIGDPQLRQLQVEGYASRWLQNNRQDAARWIEQTELLLPAAKQRLLSEDARK